MKRAIIPLVALLLANLSNADGAEPLKIPVDSPAFVFPPGNWTGDAGRCGKPGAFIAIFDIWRPEDHMGGGHMWLPMKFENGRFTITWHYAWDLVVFGSSDTKKR